MSADQDPSAELTSALNDSEAAAQGVDRLAGRLIASSKLRDRATRDNADRLLRAQKGLRGLVGVVAAVLAIIWTIGGANYAAALDDANPRYLDDSLPGGLVAPPMFAVAVTWPISERIRVSA